MTLLQFEVFLAVVDAKSFSKAAEKLNMTQSAVSQAVSALENELGATLFNRSRSGITLTEIGGRILIHAREVMRRTAYMKQEVAALIGLEIGTLRIGSIPSVSAKLLPGILASFRTRYPGIELVLFEGSYEEVRHWIESSVVDLGFITLPIDNIDTIPLMQDQMVVFLPANHPLKDSKTLTLGQIAKDPIILPSGDNDPFLRSLFRSYGITPNIQFEVRDTATLLAMVQEGVGITVLPEMAIPMSLPKVSSSYLDTPKLRNIGLGIRDLETASPAAQAFVREAQEMAKELSFKLFNSYHSTYKPDSKK